MKAALEITHSFEEERERESGGEGRREKSRRISLFVQIPPDQPTAAPFGPSRPSKLKARWPVRKKFRKGPCLAARRRKPRKGCTRTPLCFGIFLSTLVPLLSKFHWIWRFREVQFLQF